MALWIMGFGGTVPVGVLVGGWVGHATSITAVIAGGRGLGGRARGVVECSNRCERREPRMSESHADGLPRAARTRQRGRSAVDRRVAMLAVRRRRRPSGGRTTCVAHLVGVSRRRGQRPARRASRPTRGRRRRSTSVPDRSTGELLAEWDENGPAFEALLAGAPAEIAGQALLRRGDARARLAPRVGCARCAATATRSTAGWEWIVDARTRARRARDVLRGRRRRAGVGTRRRRRHESKPLASSCSAR